MDHIWPVHHVMGVDQGNNQAGVRAAELGEVMRLNDWVDCQRRRRAYLRGQRPWRAESSRAMLAEADSSQDENEGGSEPPPKRWAYGHRETDFYIAVDHILNHFECWPMSDILKRLDLWFGMGAPDAAALVWAIMKATRQMASAAVDSGEEGKGPYRMAHPPTVQRMLQITSGIDPAVLLDGRWNREGFNVRVLSELATQVCSLWPPIGQSQLQEVIEGFPLPMRITARELVAAMLMVGREVARALVAAASPVIHYTEGEGKGVPVDAGWLKGWLEQSTHVE